MSVRSLLKQDYSYPAKAHYVVLGTAGTTTIPTQNTYHAVVVPSYNPEHDAAWVFSGTHYRNNSGQPLRCDISGAVRCSTAAKAVTIALARQVNGVGAYTPIDSTITPGASGSTLSFNIKGFELGATDRLQIEIANNTDTANLDCDVYHLEIDATPIL